MNGSDEFQIRLSENFEKELKKLIRSHYRKNKAGLAKFLELIERFIQDLAIKPRFQPPLGHLEPFPQGSSCSGWELWKLEFKMPQLRGAAAQGRLIYLIDTIQKEVVLIWIYTHAEFEKRPPEKNLKRLLDDLIKFSETMEISESAPESEQSTPEEGNRLIEDAIDEKESDDDCNSDS